MALRPLNPQTLGHTLAQNIQHYPQDVPVLHVAGHSDTVPDGFDNRDAAGGRYHGTVQPLGIRPQAHAASPQTGFDR